MSLLFTFQRQTSLSTLEWHRCESLDSRRLKYCNVRAYRQSIYSWAQRDAYIVYPVLSADIRLYMDAASPCIRHGVTLARESCVIYCQWPNVLESSWNVMAHDDAREGNWRGNWRMDWVASTLHTTSEHDVSSITTADAHTSAASSRLNWRPPPI